MLWYLIACKAVNVKYYSHFILFFWSFFSLVTLLIFWAIGLMNRVFANGQGDRGSIPSQVIPKTQKNGTQRQFFKQSKAGLNSEFFFLQGLRTQSALLFTHNLGENRWIYDFSQGISIKQNAYSLIQDLNLNPFSKLIK